MKARSQNSLPRKLLAGVGAELVEIHARMIEGQRGLRPTADFGRDPFTSRRIQVGEVEDHVGTDDLRDLLPAGSHTAARRDGEDGVLEAGPSSGRKTTRKP